GSPGSGNTGPLARASGASPAAVRVDRVCKLPRGAGQLTKCFGDRDHAHPGPGAREGLDRVIKLLPEVVGREARAPRCEAQLLRGQPGRTRPPAEALLRGVLISHLLLGRRIGQCTQPASEACIRRWLRVL